MIDDLFLSTPLVAVRNHPARSDALRSARRRGYLESPLPGIYMPAGSELTWELRLLAAHLWAPTLTVVGEAAAKLTYLPELNPRVIELAGAKRASPVPWIDVTRAHVPDEFVEWRGDLRVAKAPLAAVQAARTLGGKALDEAFRSGHAALEACWAAFHAIPKQVGNGRVRTLLERSRNQPWSELGRAGHDRLDRARITGWTTNRAVPFGPKVVYVDVALDEPKLAVELDGYEFHSSRKAFEKDRVKQNLLVLDGWTVLRFTWQSLDAMVPQVRRVLARG